MNLPTIFKNRIFQHAIFWLAHVVFYATLYGSFEENYRQTFTEELIYLPGRMLFTYSVLYFLLPRYILTGKYVMFFTLFILSSFAVGMMQRFVAFQIHYPLYYPEA